MKWPNRHVRLNLWISWMTDLVLIGSILISTVHADSKPNVLLLVCDDLNCDLGCYGHSVVESPNIDRLAARGLRFQHAYCQYPLCGPSRASFMTGLYPDQSLIVHNGVRIRQRLPNVVSLPQLFRRNGYEAARVGKIYHYHVPAAIGTDGHDDPDSWDIKVNPRGRDKDEEHKTFSLKPAPPDSLLRSNSEGGNETDRKTYARRMSGRFGGILSWLAADGTDEQQTDGIAATEAVKLLKQYAKEKTPFFLAVGFYRPHTPYVAPKRYFERYSLDEISVPRVPEGYLATLPAGVRDLVTQRRRLQVDLPDDLARQAIRAYRASITFVDAQVGRVLDGLDDLGLAENTIVVFTSDHGYHMGEHGHWQKMTLFENAARVPLVIAAPGVKTAGQSATSLAELVDIYPTLAEMCGLDLPSHLSGVSLSPLLEDITAVPRRTALTQLQIQKPHHERTFFGYSVRTVDHRYTEWGAAGLKGVELYDHASDPEELINVANDSTYASIISTLSQLLRHRIDEAQRAPQGLERIVDPSTK